MSRIKPRPTNTAILSIRIHLSTNVAGPPAVPNGKNAAKALLCDIRRGPGFPLRFGLAEFAKTELAVEAVSVTRCKSEAVRSLQSGVHPHSVHKHIV